MTGAQVRKAAATPDLFRDTLRLRSLRGRGRGIIAVSRRCCFCPQVVASVNQLIRFVPTTDVPGQRRHLSVSGSASGNPRDHLHHPALSLQGLRRTFDEMSTSNSNLRRCRPISLMWSSILSTRFAVRCSVVCSLATAFHLEWRQGSDSVGGSPIIIINTLACQSMGRYRQGSWPCGHLSTPLMRISEITRPDSSKPKTFRDLWASIDKLRLSI